MRSSEKRDTTYSAKYHVFPDTFHVISRKVDYLWDSVDIPAVNSVYMISLLVVPGAEF